MSTPEIALHGTELSGHCHRVELMLRMLGLPHRYVVAADAARSSPELHRLIRCARSPCRRTAISRVRNRSPQRSSLS
jgi:hypothetical protein